jgi:hypothetical protein
MEAWERLAMRALTAAVWPLKVAAMGGVTPHS